MTETTRFAPSPTNHLHIGHAFSAWFAWAAADVAEGGRFLLRIEDLDEARSRPAFETAIFDDLAWLGFGWPVPVMRQSDRFAVYGKALDRLLAAGFAYPCFCSRKDIAREIAQAGGAPHLDAMGAMVYPGTCRGLAAAERERRLAAGEPHAIRLDALAVLSRFGALTWHDRGLGAQAVDPHAMGDVVIARKDVPASYNLAVVVDDAEQGVTLVTRGRDLAPATHVHRLLQAALNLPAPDYHHHGLVTDPDGRRLAKRDNPESLRMLRDAGVTPVEVWARLEVDDYPSAVSPV